MVILFSYDCIYCPKLVFGFSAEKHAFFQSGVIAPSTKFREMVVSLSELLLKLMQISVSWFALVVRSISFSD